MTVKLGLFILSSYFILVYINLKTFKILVNFLVLVTDVNDDLSASALSQRDRRWLGGLSGCVW